MEDTTVFSDNPVEMAAQWVAQGARRLHLVDLRVSLEKSPSGFLMIIPIYIKPSKSEFEILLMISALKIYN
jgi:phosphoribosylformimino-5-aminoimidazole carboxamide ribonucleotide (ProFAR) isomerase